MLDKSCLAITWDKDISLEIILSEYNEYIQWNDKLEKMNNLV